MTRSDAGSTRAPVRTPRVDNHVRMATEAVQRLHWGPATGPSPKIGPARPPAVRYVGPISVKVWADPPEPHETPDARSRPVLLALHGWSDGGLVYGPLARRLATVCDVVAPDAPAHGRTRWPLPRRFTFDDMLEPALWVFDAIPDLVGRQGARVVLTGHSMGALVAARLAALRPQTHHLVLEEPPARPPMPASVFRHRDDLWLRRVQLLDHEGRKAMTGHLDDWSTEELDAWSQSKAELDVPTMSGLRGCGEPLERTLRRVRTPTTLVLGAESQGQSSDRRVARLQRIAGWGLRAVRLPGAGHNPRREAPDGFVAVIAAAAG